MGIEPTSSAWKAEVLPLNYTRADGAPLPAAPLSGAPSALEWWRGKDSNLRRRKPADLQSAPVGRLGTPPQNEPRILILLRRGVNASWPVICLPRGSDPPAVRGTRGPEGRAQPREGGTVREPRFARAHAPGELDRTVADTQQPAHIETDRLPQPPHLAVAALVQHDAEAAVGTLAGRVRADAIEPRRAVLERHPCQEAPDDVRPRVPPQSHQVFPL